MIRAYQKGDAKHVVVQDEQIKEAKNFVSCFETINAYSLVDDDGTVLAVCGFIINTKSEGECFALLGKYCGKKLLEFVRFGKKEIPEKMKSLRIKKVFITVRKGFVAGERMARILGFYKVGVLKKFYLNNDYQLYERK